MKVYGYKNENGVDWHFGPQYNRGKDTHMASLINIKKIDSCKHRTLRHNLGDPNMATCEDCHKKVMATWREA